MVEACAAGVPVLGSGIPALEEIVEEGRTGRLVSAGAPLETAAATLELLGSPELRSRLGAAGRSVAVRRFSFETTVTTLPQVYLDILGTRGRRGREGRLSALAWHL